MGKLQGNKFYYWETKAFNDFNMTYIFYRLKNSFNSIQAFSATDSACHWKTQMSLALLFPHLQRPADRHPPHCSATSTCTGPRLGRDEYSAGWYAAYGRRGFVFSPVSCNARRKNRRRRSGNDTVGLCQRVHWRWCARLRACTGSLYLNFNLTKFHVHLGRNPFSDLPRADCFLPGLWVSMFYCFI